MGILKLIRQVCEWDGSWSRSMRMYFRRMISMHALLDISISSSLLNSLHIQYCLAGLFRIPWQSHIKSSAVALASLTILNSILVHLVDTVDPHVLIMRHLLVHIC